VGQHLHRIGSRISLRFRMIIHLANKIPKLGVVGAFGAPVSFSQRRKSSAYEPGMPGRTRLLARSATFCILKGGSPS
jgi:hypothetical protein